MRLNDLQTTCYCFADRVPHLHNATSNGSCPDQPVPNPAFSEGSLRDAQAATYRNLQAATFRPIEDDEIPANDPVEHPAHYTSSPAKCSGCGKPIECIDVIQHMVFPVGAAVKYLWRLDLKGDAVEDLRKARKYIDFELARREASS